MRDTIGPRLLAWAERVFLITGAVLLAWFAYAVAERHVAQYFAHESLVAMPAVEPPARRPGAARAAPAVGTPLGGLSIPRLGLSAVILHGSDARTLRRGVGHIENTALPGEPGNVAIAGHRDTFFRSLEHVRVGDEVLLERPQGRVRYRVASLDVVPPSDVSVLRPSRDETLTLITCYPFWIFGHAPDRFIVRATRVADGAAQVRTAAVAAALERPAPPAPTAAPAASPDTTGRHAVGDEVLVRRVIERFRRVYNGRFTHVRQERAEGPLMFTGCEVNVAGERATATCRTHVTAPDHLDTRTRTFSLEKINGAWAIRSFAMS